MKNSRDLLIKFDGQLCTLIKDRCDKENDTGMYRLTAVNSVGQAESTCQVIVQKNKIPLRHERVQSTTTTTSRSAPVLVQTLQDQTINEGHRLILQIRLAGQTKPQITWSKNNQPIRNTADYLVSRNAVEKNDDKRKTRDLVCH